MLLKGWCLSARKTKASEIMAAAGTLHPEAVTRVVRTRILTAFAVQACNCQIMHSSFLAACIAWSRWHNAVAPLQLCYKLHHKLHYRSFGLPPQEAPFMITGRHRLFFSFLVLQIVTTRTNATSSTAHSCWPNGPVSLT
jgi:hypothetical protein